MKNRFLIDVEENCTAPEWLNKVGIFIEKIAEALNITGEEVSILFCTDAFIKKLNLQYRNIDSPTDVLSFEDGSVYTDEEGEWNVAGDIAISLDMLNTNAEYFEVSANEELKRLLIHGFLHLNGYDHGEEHLTRDKEPTCEMLILQEKLMRDFESFILIA